jgi:hypothetical protein
MLTIRQEQFAAFSQAELRKFEEWTMVHAKKFFPRHCQKLGDPQLRELIRYGMKRSVAHGFIAKNDVCKYIDLMVVFGRDFEADNRYPWAREILATGGNAGFRMRRLYEAAKRHLRGL